MPSLKAEPFGLMPDGQSVDLYTVTNAAGMTVCFLSLGGIITRVQVPDRYGALADVTPGYDSLAEYLTDTCYFGALIGRYANRIAGGRFVLDGREYQAPPNDGKNLLHGGYGGFHRVVWHVAPFANSHAAGAALTYTSRAGEEGFPGTVRVRVTYTLNEGNELRFDYAATTDAPTPVSLTQHTYVNLAGHASGDILSHELTLLASRYLPVDDEIIPTGELRSVDGTPFDFRRARTIGEGIRSRDVALPMDGYDHTFVLDSRAPGEMELAARLYERVSGRMLEIETTEPGIQLYSGGQLGGGASGKDGYIYRRHDALALETQHFPDSPNVPAFPSTILRPGQRYVSSTVYRFGVA